MKFLLIDNSNSRTKFILSSPTEHVGELVRLDTPLLSLETLEEIVGDWEFDAVMVCSVVPDKAKLLQGYFDGTPFHLLKHDSDHGITIDITHPETVGADRIANAIGVMALYQAPAVVIDFGTAVTFDVVDVGGVYRGGVIAPGLGSMNDYLSKKTALLPSICIEEPAHAIGKSTTEAMMAGVVYGYRGLVVGILQAIEKEMAAKPFIISTGGDGRVIASGVSQIDEFSNQITLEGLRVAAVNIFCS